MTRRRLWEIGSAVFLTGALIGSLVVPWALMPKVTVTTEPDGTKVATVARRDLRPQDVQPFTPNPVVSQAMNAVRTRGGTVQAVAVTTGTVTFKNPPAFNNVEQPQSAAKSTQIEAVAVSGEDKKGQPTIRLDLFQIGDYGQRTPVSDSRIAIVSQPQLPRWRFGLAVQAGVGLTGSYTGKQAAAAVVAFPLLRRGTSSAAEHNTWALLTPAVIVGQDIAEPALLPLSWRLPIPILRDIWVSPVVSRARAGVVVTATF